MKLTLKEAIQSRKLKLIASELEALARKDRNVKKIVDQLKKGKEPSPSDITSLRGDTQDDVVMAFASVIGPSKTSDFLGESKEDPDIGDREGSQPAKYHSGLAKSTKKKRDAQFKKQSEMSDDDPDAYKPAPGDKEAETKPSKYTKKFDKMFGEHVEELEEQNVEKALKNKSEKTGVAYGILKKVYDRGVAAWRTGHRPGTTPSQWGLARVNSFVTGGKTQKTTDKDLWAKHKGKNESVELDEAVQVDDQRYVRSHKSKPKGRGSWLFTTKPMGKPKDSEVFTMPMGDYEQAKKQAQKWAEKKGASVVYVMESVELEEAKMNVGDTVRVKDKPKNVVDRQFFGKAGVISSKAGRDFMVKFPNGRSIVVDPQDLELTEEVKPMSKYLYSEAKHNPMHVSKAVRVAKSMGGNMTGAVEKIEKMAKGLSEHPKVKEALRMANEEVVVEKAESEAQAIAARIALKHKREGTQPEKGSASAEMMKMSEKDLEDFTKMKKGAPYKVKEDYTELLYGVKFELNEAKKIPAAQLKRLRDEYGKIEKMNVTGPAYKKLQKFLDNLGQEELKAFANADIKWLSRMSKRRLNENVEDMEPASPDEKRMAMKQAEFIQYVGREIGEHLVANKEFPEWMQNKLSALHQKAKDMHATLGAHGGDMDESFELDEAVKIDPKKLPRLNYEEERVAAILKKANLVYGLPKGAFSFQKPAFYDPKTGMSISILKKGDAFAASGESGNTIQGPTDVSKLESFLKKHKLMKEEVELDEEQKLFMFTTKPEAQKKAKEIRGKVLELGPKNFAVVTKDLTVVREATSVTNYNPKSQGGTRKELITKYRRTKNPKDAAAARKAGATQKELQGVAEDVELKENKNLIKDYQAYMAKGNKKDSNAIDFLMSIPKYKKMSRDQISKIIGDAKRKGIFNEEVEVHENFIRSLRQVADKLGLDGIAWKLLDMEKDKAAEKITQPDIDGFVKDAEEAYPLIKKNYQRYYKSLINKLKKAKGREALDMMQEIARYISKIQSTKKMRNEEVELTESHYKVGQRVTCIESGMKGTVVHVDPSDEGKYYTVKRDDGKKMKYAPDELKPIGEVKESKMDDVDRAALKKKFKNRKDKDIDNDGDVDDSDEYLHKRRQAVSKAIAKEEKMDDVDKEALKKKFKDRKDKDIDNDGDVDSSDEYLHKRRQAVSKAMAKEQSEVKLKEKDSDKDGDADDLDKSLEKRKQKVLDTSE